MNQQERAAMQAALDAYEADDGFAQHHAAELLRAALAQPEQEPVAWVYPHRYGSGVQFPKPVKPDDWDDEEGEWYCRALIYAFHQNPKSYVPSNRTALRRLVESETAMNIGTSKDAQQHAEQYRRGQVRDESAPHHNDIECCESGVDCQGGKYCPRRADDKDFALRWAPAITLLALIVLAALILPLLWHGLTELWELLRETANQL